MRLCNSTSASSTEKNCPLKIKEVMLSWLAGGDLREMSRQYGR